MEIGLCATSNPGRKGTAASWLALMAINIVLEWEGLSAQRSSLNGVKQKHRLLGSVG